MRPWSSTPASLTPPCGPSPTSSSQSAIGPNSNYGEKVPTIDMRWGFRSVVSRTVEIGTKDVRIFGKSPVGCLRSWCSVPSKDHQLAKWIRGWTSSWLLPRVSAKPSDPEPSRWQPIPPSPACRLHASNCKLPRFPTCQSGRLWLAFRNRTNP